MSACQIVLIEDNPGDVVLTRLALEQHDVLCEMTVFTDGEAALDALCPPEDAKLNPSVPDAILLDLNMPRSDGFSVLIRLKQTPRFSNVPIAIITSSQASSDKARVNRLGAVRYIEKPSQLDAFLSTVGLAVKEMLGERSLSN